MERRQFDRSLPKEPGPKKPRLADDRVAADRSSNMRPMYMQRQVPANSGVGARIQRDRDAESSDSSRRPSQAQQAQVPHLELVNQYKSALSELTFNSKPIITNLTIIAGENLHAAKAIASTVCTNILEVPKEQKLPSLYLLDSIVKNIGRDYIKYFAPKLPEVFCKAYRQVDPSIHQGMRHLFGTWKGVFPAETLHIIQKELGFTNSANGPSLGMTTSRPDAQTQRPSGHAHGIHVNPKYLEARGSASEIGEALVSSREEAEALGRSTSNKIHRRDQGTQLFSVGDEKVSSMPYLGSEYGSNLSARASVGTRGVKEKFIGQELDRTWYESGSELPVENLPNERNGFRTKHGIGSQTAHPSVRNPIVVSRSWKNSEEEEYTWDDMKAKRISHGAAKTADPLFKNSWTSAVYEEEDFANYQQRPRMLNDRESDIYDDDIADFVSSRTDPEVSEHQLQFKNAIDYSDGYLSLHDSSSKIGRTPFLSQLGSSPNGNQNLDSARSMISRSRDNVAQQRQMHVAATSTALSAKRQRPPSPPISSINFSQQPNKPVDSNRTSYGPTDPRRPPSLRSTGSADQFLQNSHLSPSREVQESTPQRPKLQNVRTAPSRMPTSQQRKPVASTQIRKPEVSELEASSDGRNMMSSQVSRSRSHLNIESSSSGHSNPLTADSPGQSISSNVLKAILVDVPSPVSSSSKPSIQDAGLAEDDERVTSGNDASFLHGVGVEEIPRAISTPSNQFSSLFSSLVEKGLISGSKSDSPSSSSPQRRNQPPPAHPLLSSTASISDSSVPVPREDALLSKPSSSKLPDEDSSDKAFSVLPKSATEIKNLIGFEFRPDVLRNLHPDVLADLFSDLPHNCGTCGLGLKLEESVSKHMEWHAFREQNSLNVNSRSWYKSLLDWFSEIDHGVPAESSLDLVGEEDVESESIEHMVPADETQIACIMCGELFEDFYSLERDEWMFKGAVYLNNPTEDSSEPSGSTGYSASMGPIVHVDCKSEDFIQNLQVLSNPKLVNDE